MGVYSKRPFSISEQIDKFEREGFLLNERDEAEKLLSYGIADIRIFENWIHALATLRNLCAHHNRVWNRRFMVNMVMPHDTSRPFMDGSDGRRLRVTKLFPLLSAIKYLMDAIDPSNGFKTSLMELLDRPVRLLSLRNMGFPNNWEMMPVWQ